MNTLLPELGTSADFGVVWPTWIAAGGFGLFCLLGFYATVLLLAGKHLPAQLRFLQLPSLRGRMLLGYVLVATLPVISLALVLSERTTNERLETTSTILTSQAESIAGIADSLMQRYVNELTDAARIIQPRLTNPDLPVETPMLQVHRMTTGIMSMIAADTSGRVVATTQKAGDTIVASEVHALTNLNEEYFTAPLRTGEPYISGRLEDPAGRFPIAAAIGVPIVDADATVSGVLMGFYDLVGLSRAQSPLADRHGIRTLMLDRTGQIMFASANTGLSIRDNLAGRPMLSAPDRAPGETFDFVQTAESSGETVRYLGTAYPIRGGWKLILYQPLAQIEDALLDDYGVALVWLAGALLISICLALALANSLSDPLESLAHSVRNFDLNLNQPTPEPSSDAPRELLTIFDHLRSLDMRLRGTYQQLRKSVHQGEKLRGELIYVIATREKEIEQRTEELKVANETLERLSREDSLTGLANRRWFAEFLAGAWQRALRDKTPICILIMDIDDFKAFNDNYGHQKGDTCLKLVANTIRRAVGRASDLVSRYGGEEFIVVLGDTPLEGGLKIAENIRAAVERLGIEHTGAKRHGRVTVSVGVTSTLPTRDTQPDAVLVAADRAMYNAKNDGKNKVAFSTGARTGTYQALCVPGDAGNRLS